MAWTNPTTRTTGTLITASIWNTDLVDNLTYLKTIADQVDGVRILWKSANETVNNSATLQDDADITFSVAANTKYKFFGELHISAATSGSTMDLKTGWSLPSGATAIYNPTYAEFTGINSAFQLTATGAQSAELATSASQLVHLQGVITVSSTAGTAVFQWAQQTATAQDLILLPATNFIIISSA